ncbi:MAG: cysteine--tRNA ligase [Bacteroidales bacterium]|nr:cysteine--tRNA ligase [Bacteroidales bacterium]
METNIRKHNLCVTNTITRKKEVFEPLHAPLVGMYVCGPTVYGDPHLGHARSAVTFDIVFRYLGHLGYKVRYVRNITDVGHLEHDADQGEDKIAKKARLEQLEPMEVAQHYTNRYHFFMDKMGVERPSIEPLASGHIIEQIELIKKILETGMAYEINGSVYFDVMEYNRRFPYGKLSGRVLEELMATTRDNLASQDEKRNAADFALWKKAQPEHIMRWPSPWSDGFPGWHTECTAMSQKYLGMPFDIHGGGMDLMFPHHEAEIAQSNAAFGKEPCRYWLHNNMITVNGKKMGKSLGNFITLEEFFTGKHEALQQAYEPMTIRFFILQAHYRSTLDFSNEALISAEKGLQRLLQMKTALDRVKPATTSGVRDFLSDIRNKCYAAMDDDFNTPVLISHLFDVLKTVNASADNKSEFTAEDIAVAKNLYEVFVERILGLQTQAGGDKSADRLTGVMDIVLDIRAKAKAAKDFATSDLIRDELKKIGISVMDGKEGAAWTVE